MAMTTLGFWRITTTYDWTYLVNITSINDYRGGAVSGPYWINDEAFECGTFPLCEIQKMEKCS